MRPPLYLPLLISVLWGCGRHAATPDPPASNGTADSTDEQRTAFVPIDLPRSSDQLTAPETASAGEEAPPHVLADAAETPPGTSPEPAQRFVLFAPGGPLVMELVLTIDAKPAASAMNELVDLLLAEADTDDDGRGTWSELTTNPKVRLGQFGNPVMSSDRARRQQIDLCDVDRDGQIDRDEIPRFITSNRDGGRAFALRRGALHRGYRKARSAVWKMLDADADFTLSKDEIAAVNARLRSRDTNDDDILYPSEFQPAASGEGQRMRAYGPPTARQLDVSTDWDAMRYALQEHYPQSDLSDRLAPLVPDFRSQLDADGNGHLSVHEVAALSTIEPHVILAAHFNKNEQADEQTMKLEVRTISDTLSAKANVVRYSPQHAVLEMPRFALDIYVDDRARVDSRKLAETRLTALDADKNGYIESTEVGPGNQALGLPFEAVDVNGDGKAYVDELSQVFRQRQASWACQIRATAGDVQDAIYRVLDADADGRLGSREMAEAADRLRSLDTDGDGAIDVDEVPDGMTLTVARGDVASNNNPFSRTLRPLPRVGGPAWFRAMDANSDGDVSPREFLGTIEQFEQVDADQDGFLEPQEARQLAETGSDLSDP